MVLYNILTCKCKNRKGEIDMKNSYVNRLIESQTICTLNDKRTIITDRMGSWNEQNVVLTWEGHSDKGSVSITPDEVEGLFTNGLTKNVVRGENGTLYEEFTFSDIRTFGRAIVCGILAPSIQKNLRHEILEYAKKMGYVTNTMTPVEMFSGTKSLICNTDGTYSIFFRWHDNILKKINQKFLYTFTRNFFSNYPIEIKSDGILMANLSENEVFSRENIDIFRVYDIQLFYISPDFDKKLLLRAVMKIAFMGCWPFHILREGQFEKIGNISIPEDRQERLTFNKFEMCHMNCGIVYHGRYNNEIYRYKITVPYTECIRQLMIDTEKLLKAKYGKKVSVSFSGFNQDIEISYKNENISSNVERELISLDYALTFLRDERKFNRRQLYYSIISLLEADSSELFRNEYFSYLETLKRVLPDKKYIML